MRLEIFARELYRPQQEFSPKVCSWEEAEPLLLNVINLNFHHPFFCTTLYKFIDIRFASRQTGKLLLVILGWGGGERE